MDYFHLKTPTASFLTSEGNTEENVQTVNYLKKH